jgi:hypothetical protein
MRKINISVGITIESGVLDPNLSLWSSGIMQNIIYLAKLLQKLPCTQGVYLILVDGGDSVGHPIATAFGFSTMNLGDALNELDVIIELGVRLPKDASSSYREHGGFLVSYMAGNAMIMNLEAVSSRLPYGEVVNHSGYDAVWLTPQHVHTNNSYVKLTRSNHVYSAPHIWDSMVIDHYNAQQKRSFKWTPPKEDFGWRLVNFEPNVNVVKTFHLPFLVCESAYRLRPDLIKHLYLMNTQHMTGQIHFEEFIGVSDLAKAGRVTSEGRIQIADVLGVHANAVVAHQWENALNYHYWDVLYGGFPLIHNSPMLANAGYYYPDFDPVRGGRVLVDALINHSKNLHEYKKNAAQTLWRFSIDNPDVQAIYAELLMILFDSRS